MKNLFNFIFKHAHWLLFLLLTTVSLYLFVHNSEFQRSKYLAVFQETAGRVYSITNSVHSYLNLKKTNTDLMHRIATLEEEIQIVRTELENYTGNIYPDSINVGINQPVYRLTYARIQQNRISAGPNNYIMLDRGSNHGIKEDMAVISVKGVVGVVSKVTTNFSTVIPLLSKFILNGMIKNTRFCGDLSWDGKDPRFISLSGLPSHASYSIGDTIITSGNSAIFPEGVLVGVVEGAFKLKNEESNSLKVRLFTDFSTLREVFVVENPFREEQILLEKGVEEQ